jgi:hypothetical protein
MPPKSASACRCFSWTTNDCTRTIDHILSFLHTDHEDYTNTDRNTTVYLYGPYETEWKRKRNLTLFSLESASGFGNEVLGDV